VLPLGRPPDRLRRLIDETGTHPIRRNTIRDTDDCADPKAVAVHTPTSIGTPTNTPKHARLTLGQYETNEPTDYHTGEEFTLDGV
jgi:hypothetical protein